MVLLETWWSLAVVFVFAAFPPLLFFVVVVVVVVVVAVSSVVAVVEFLGLTTLFSVLPRLVFVSTKFILQTKNICCNTLESVNIFS